MRVPILCLVLTASAVAQSDRRPPPYKSEEDGFTVALPGKPVRETYQLKTVAGTLTVHNTRHDTGSELRLSVTVTTYPPEFAKAKPEQILAGVLKEMKGADGKTADEGEVTVGAEKHPGRKCRIEAGKTVIRARIFLVGTRLYQVIAVGSRAGAESNAAEEFLRSFDLTR